MNGEFENNQNLPESNQPEQPVSADMPSYPREPEQTYTQQPQTNEAYHDTGDTIPTGSAGAGQSAGNPYAAPEAAGYSAAGSYQTTGGYTGAGSYGAPQGGQSAAQGYGPQAGYGAQIPQYPGAGNPMASYNVEPPKKKKKSGGARVAAIAIACVLVGGIGGGAAVGAYFGNATTPALTEEKEEKSPAPTAAIEEPEETAPAFNNTVIDVTTNSQATTMTPQDVYEKYVNAVVAISNQSTTNVFGQETTTASSGSGFIISEDGYIVTNNHVVSGAETLTVIMTSGEEYEAELIGADAENDVALIKIDATDLPTVSVGDSDDIQVGQQVCAIGNPLGELTNTMTVGYVSALDREINENSNPINMFQTDCAINSGNSGGPLFDMHGNVVGITTAKYSSNGYSSSASIEGIGFCIPANDAMDIVGDLLQYGYVKGRPSLGITCGAVSKTVTQYYKLPAGVCVVSVEEDSAADHAGLTEGDIITAVDDTEVTSVTEFKAALKNYSAGDTAILHVYHGAEAGMVDVTVVFDEKQNAAKASNETQQETQQMIPQIPGFFN